MLDEGVLDWLQDKPCDKDGVPTCVQKLSEGIYQFPILKPAYVQMWLEEIQNINKFLKDNKIPNEPPNHYNQHGLNIQNFEWFNGEKNQIFTKLIDHVIQPIAMELWWGIGEDSLSAHNTFTVDYHQTRDKKLELHIDDSEITINYCLGQEFTGGDLVFEGMRCR